MTKRATAAEHEGHRFPTGMGEQETHRLPASIAEREGPRFANTENDGYRFPSGRLALYEDCADPLSVEGSRDVAAAFDPRPFLAKLPVGRSARAYGRSAVVFSQGDVADAVYWIASGEVKLTVVSHDGKEAVIALLAPGSFLGEGCLAGQPLYTATATAMQPTAAICMPREAMTGLLHREPAFAAGFTAYLLSRHIRMEQDLLDQLFNSSEKRLARLLLLMAHDGEQGRAAAIDKLSHETLAEMIGTTRSRVTYFLNRFRKLGFIDYKDGLRVHNSLRLVLDE